MELAIAKLITTDIYLMHICTQHTDMVLADAFRFVLSICVLVTYMKIACVPIIKSVTCKLIK